MRKTIDSEFSRCTGCGKRFRHPFVTVIAWMFGIVLVFGVVMVASRPQPLNPAPKENEDPSLSRAVTGAISYLRGYKMNFDMDREEIEPFDPNRANRAMRPTFPTLS